MRNILLIGADGQLGRELHRGLHVCGKLIPLCYPEIDLTQPGRLPGLLDSLKPDIIFNAAAYTQVDKAEEDLDNARLINSESPGVIANYCADKKIPLIHYSTDYVFDGNTDRDYLESDEATPNSVYGRTKLEGERLILESGAMAVIFRTSWLYSLYGANFLLTMIRLAKEKKELKVVNDQTGQPTWARSLAEASCQMYAMARGRERDFFTACRGIYHATSTGEPTTWHGFTREIIRLLNRDAAQDYTIHSPEQVLPVGTDAFPRPAPRPKRSVLDCTKLRQQFGLDLGGWKENLRLCLDSAQ